MDFQLKGAVAVVTGATRGLGLAVTEAYVEEGAHVLAVSRSQPGLEELEARWPGQVVGHRWADASTSEVPGVIATAMDAWGRIDVLVNNAGYGEGTPFLDTEESGWRAIFEANVFTPMLLMQEAIKVFSSQGSGRVVNIASTAGITGKPLLAAYSASKAALIRLSEAVAAEVAPLGVRINTLAPGAFETDASAHLHTEETLMTRRLRKIPAGRLGLKEELGPLVMYLSSPLSDFVAGSTFVIDGGEVSKL